MVAPSSLVRRPSRVTVASFRGASSGGVAIGSIAPSASMTSEADPSSPAVRAEGRPPRVLQVVPQLMSGGVERGTIEISAALTAAGWESYVASAGGKMVHEITRHGG